MRLVAAAGAVLLVAAGCMTTAPRPTAVPAAVTPEPTNSSGLHVGQMAVVVAGQLRQVADPNRPADRAFESAAFAEGRVLHPLGEAQRVLVVGGPTNPNGDVYWQVADDSFPGCCAPFGWVRETSSNGDPALKQFTVDCPTAGSTLSGDDLIALGVMEAASCLRGNDFKLHGEVRCARPTVDSFLSITGPDWVNDQVLCNIDQAVPLYGPAVTALYDAQSGELFDEDVELVAHFNDRSAEDCRWAPGNFRPIPIDNAPPETAQFACRMSVYVTSATPVSR